MKKERKLICHAVVPITALMRKVVCDFLHLALSIPEKYGAFVNEFFSFYKLYKDIIIFFQRTYKIIKTLAKQALSRYNGE